MSRIKIKEGDCVSVPNSYFGSAYMEILNESGVDKIFGRVTMVVDGNRDFHVKWDLDNEISKSMSLDKVTYEPLCTTFQVKPVSATTAAITRGTGLITVDDF